MPRNSDFHELRKDALRIFSAGLSEVHPRVCIPRALSLTGNRLSLRDCRTPDAHASLDLGAFERVFVVGGGKASVEMCAAACEILGKRITRGVVVTKYGHTSSQGQLPGCIEVIEAGHPEPDSNGLSGARKAAEILSGARESDLVIALISGGASALWTMPCDGVSIDEKRALTRLLLACGADIHEINTVRKHLSALKGGQAARLASRARVLSVMISDVIGDDPAVIGSGPFCEDPSTFQEAWEVIRKYDLEENSAPSILEVLRRGMAGELAETPKPGQGSWSARISQVVCATNSLALISASKEARQLGYQPVILTDDLSGAVEDAAKWFVNQIIERTVGERSTDLCLLAGGETTVKFDENHGLGGRNQELAVRVGAKLSREAKKRGFGADFGKGAVTFLSCGTDGTDGPTDAAGGICDAAILGNALDLGLSADEALGRHDCYHFLEKIQGLVKTGPTGTNVMDIQVALIAGNV